MEQVILSKVLVMAVCVALLGGQQCIVACSEGKSAAPAATQDEALPGSTVSLDDAAKVADIVVVATISTAEVNRRSGYGIKHHRAEILIAKVLKGKSKDAQLSVAYRVVSTPDKEVAPKEKGSYIFFVQCEKPENGDKPEKGDSPVSLRAVKILADTQGNREAVAKALAPKTVDGKK